MIPALSLRIIYSNEGFTVRGSFLRLPPVPILPAAAAAALALATAFALAARIALVAFVARIALRFATLGRLAAFGFAALVLAYGLAATGLAAAVAVALEPAVDLDAVLADAAHAGRREGAGHGHQGYEDRQADGYGNFAHNLLLYSDWSILADKRLRLKPGG
jgi:hypothetical protein